MLLLHGKPRTSESTYRSDVGRRSAAAASRMDDTSYGETVKTPFALRARSVDSRHEGIRLQACSGNKCLLQAAPAGNLSRTLNS